MAYLVSVQTRPDFLRILAYVDTPMEVLGVLDGKQCIKDGQVSCPLRVFYIDLKGQSHHYSFDLATRTSQVLHVLSHDFNG